MSEITTVDALRKSGNIFFETVAGSHAYGTSTPKSDEDIRGFYALPESAFSALKHPPAQIGDEKHDTVYYNTKRAFELLMTANPNMIELLWMPEDCIRVMTPPMEMLMANRDVFISKKCYHTHSGYAFAQIKKARGQNKKVHNPQPEEMPVKEDFCWVVPWKHFCGYKADDVADHIFPARPVPLKETRLDLSKYHVAAMEHTVHTYRLYYYGDAAKGVFRGDDMLVPESISIEDEFDQFSGLLIYNQGAYEKALKEWHSYWDWMKNRNDSRWVDQEKGKLNYDQKNMMHCMRLLMSGEEILLTGEPIVRFEDARLDYLMKIRSGEMEYEEIMAEVERRMERLERIYKETSEIPNRVDEDRIQTLFTAVVKCSEAEGLAN